MILSFRTLSLLVATFELVDLVKHLGGCTVENSIRLLITDVALLLHPVVAHSTRFTVQMAALGHNRIFHEFSTKSAVDSDPVHNRGVV